MASDSNPGPVLEIDDLHVAVEGKEILQGVSLAVPAGEVHALMGPNGSGKSTLAATLLGNPAYEVTAGRILFEGEDVTALSTNERASRGLFLGFQHPEEIPGVSVLNFLRQAMSARKGIEDFSVLEVRMALLDWAKRLGMDTRFIERYLNEGFSGGEKKRNEILQMALMEPDFAVLDETDSGLDIDALGVVARGIDEVREARPELGILLITHYRRILEHLTPDAVHILLGGRIVASGGRELADRLEREGFDAFRTAEVGGMTEVLDVGRVKADFPIFERKVNGKPLVYLDSASSSQKPRAVLDAMEHHHRHHYANVHRGIYTIAEESTAAYEGARAKVAKLLNARATGEIVFTKNITEAMNLVAYSWARKNLGPGDAVVITEMEHHANIVPWHILVEERGVELRWIPITDDFQLDLTDLDRLLDGAKLLSVTAMSNVLGTLNDIRLLSDAAHAAGALVIVDAAQAVPHLPVDVQAWDADFVGFTGHKMLGPTGIGGLWAASRAARRDAAVPRRRRDDHRRALRRLRAQRGAVEVRGRAPCRSSRPAASPPPSTTSRRWAWTPCAPTRSSSPSTRSARSRSASRTGCTSTARATSTTAAARSRSCSTASTPTTSPRCSTRTACACGRRTTAPSR